MNVKIIIVVFSWFIMNLVIDVLGLCPLERCEFCGVEEGVGVRQVARPRGSEIIAIAQFKQDIRPSFEGSGITISHNLCRSEGGVLVRGVGWWGEARALQGSRLPPRCQDPQWGLQRYHQNKPPLNFLLSALPNGFFNFYRLVWEHKSAEKRQRSIKLPHPAAPEDPKLRGNAQVASYLSVDLF